MHDLAADPRCSFTLTEAQIPYNASCGSKGIDPEDPRCARLTLSGKFKNINGTSEGWGGPAQAALFQRHPAMTEWAGGSYGASRFMSPQALSPSLSTTPSSPSLLSLFLNPLPTTRPPLELDGV